MRKRIFRALLRPLVDRQVYECLTVDWTEANRLGPGAPSGADGVRVRAVERSELAHLRAGGEYGISEKFLRDVAQRPDSCFGAFIGDTLVSYVFFAPLAPTAIDEHLRFDFPPGWIYVYKALTLPAWRGRGLLPRLLKSAMPAVGTSLHRPPPGFVTLVVAGNDASSKAFERCGFRKAQQFPVWTTLSRRRHIASPARSGFSISAQV